MDSLHPGSHINIFTWKVCVRVILWTEKPQIKLGNYFLSVLINAMRLGRSNKRVFLHWTRGKNKQEKKFKVNTSVSQRSLSKYRSRSTCSKPVILRQHTQLWTCATGQLSQREETQAGWRRGMEKGGLWGWEMQGAAGDKGWGGGTGSLGLMPPWSPCCQGEGKGASLRLAA